MKKDFINKSKVTLFGLSFWHILFCHWHCFGAFFVRILALLPNIIEEFPHSLDNSPLATSTLWTTDEAKKRPEYYEVLKEKYKEFLGGNELLIPYVLEAVTTRTTSLLTSDAKSQTNRCQSGNNGGGS